MGKRIPQHFIEDILAQTDIVELIQARVKLTKRGQNYLACCPFHNEKNPSFTVSQTKQFFHCFGCSANGNAIGFLMDYDHMDFVDAVTELANRQGIDIPFETSSAESKQYQDSYKLLNEISVFYQQQLREAKNAIQYLKSRGLTGQTAKEFSIGYAQEEWDGLLNHYKSTPELQSGLLDNGLIIQKESGRCFDRFRHRIMFPIRNVKGNVIGFGGRTITDEQPKYMNSPETKLFHKGDELYGLYEALKKNRDLPHIMIVEGYMDVIALHQHGLTATVATLGTATNIKHLQKLLRYTSQIIFCFDGDKAGKQAAWKALTQSLPSLRDGIQIKFLYLPEGDDPDSLIQRIGQKGYEQRLQSALPISEVFFNHLQQEFPVSSPDTKAVFAKKASEYLNHMPEGLLKDLFYEQLAKHLRIFVKDLTSLQSQPAAKRKNSTRKTQQLLSPAFQAISLLLKEPRLVLELTQQDHIEDIILPGVPLLNTLISLLKENAGLSTGALLTRFDAPEDQNIISTLAARDLTIPASGVISEFKGAIRRIIEQQDDQLKEALIQKAKISNLSPDDKKQLISLITKSQLSKQP